MNALVTLDYFLLTWWKHELYELREFFLGHARTVVY